MPNVAAGSILIAQSVGEWVNEQNWELTGTVNTGDLIAPGQLYLGASASSTPNYYVGYYIVLSTFNPSNVGEWFDSQVTAYNSTTKVATVAWAAAFSSPPVGTQWRCMVMFPVQSSYRWQRDSVDITNELTRVYTTTAADIGKTISFRTVGGSLPKGTSPSSNAYPTITSSNPSATSYTVTGPTPSGNFVNASTDFTLLGAMRLPQYWSRSFCIVPASKSPNGQKCLYTSGANPYNNQGAFLTIPVLTQNYSTTPSTWGSFPANSICQTITASSDIFNGLLGVGIIGGGNYVSSSHVIDSTYMITGYCGSYDTSSYPMAVLARRPVDLSLSGPVELFVLNDPSQSTSIVYNRWRSGQISEIPSQYRTALGGDLMIACAGVSIHSNLSQGPACFVFDSANIAPALAKATTGTSVSGTSTTIVLDTNANTSTPDYYKDCYLVIGSNISIRITGYNNSTRTATVGSAVLPTTSSSYRIIPNVNGKTLLGYTGASYFGNDAYGAIWDPSTTTSYAQNGIIINNTKSYVCGITSSYGAWDYGISFDARPNGYGGGARLFCQYGKSTTNADQLSHYFIENSGPLTLVVFNTDDMANVASGSASYSSLNPKAIFNISCPYTGIPAFGGNFQFDNTDGKLYVQMDLAAGPENVYPIILVYQCGKWS